MKERSDLICGKAAVGGNYNSTRDIKTAYNKNVKIEKAIAAMAMQVAERRYNVDGGLEEYLFGLLEDK